jgi:NlpC/P60 family protein
MLFALRLCAAVLLGRVSFALADQTPTTGHQTQPAGLKAPATRPPAIPAGMRLLSLKEGRAIVQGMAWADDEEGLSPDCSHLVHTLYQQAGYSYPYASSLDLYRGAPQFLRVRYPHPGDLIVWRGHVGIVVNPKEHSFFSSVSTGTRIQDYDSPYWRARGHARFYRYLTSRPEQSGGQVEEAINRPPQPKPQAQSSTTTRASDPPALQTVKTARAPVAKTRAEAVNKAPTEVASSGTARGDNAKQIPLPTGKRQPQAADVANALAVANLNASEILRAADLERLEQPVVVYRELQVSGVELKGKRGAAQVQIETLAAVSAERMEAQQGWEDHQLELQRTKKGWVMMPADQNVYVPREAALRILASRLASLTQSADRSTVKDREQAEIIRFLNLLVE